MSDFPEGVTAPDGAQRLVDICKGTWAVINDDLSSVSKNAKAVGSSNAGLPTPFLKGLLPTGRRYD
jgi:hypothetical protein